MSVICSGDFCMNPVTVQSTAFFLVEGNLNVRKRRIAFCSYACAEVFRDRVFQVAPKLKQGEYRLQEKIEIRNRKIVRITKQSNETCFALTQIPQNKSEFYNPNSSLN